MNGLQIKNVCIKLGERVLIDVDATIQPGKILTIMGPSGSGKSTLLALIGGFLDPVFDTSGLVVLDGATLNDRPAHERHTGILFQDPLLFPHMTVGENLSFAIPANIGKQQRRNEVEEALESAGLAGFSNRDPATLSGGQKARVALMRVLLSQPKALLLDEPFSKLDAHRRDQMRGFVFDLARKENLPTLLVTHDEADAVAAGGSIIRLKE